MIRQTLYQVHTWASFFFRESEISWDIHHLAANDWFLTDFDRFLPIFDLFFSWWIVQDSPVILEYSVKYCFFSRAHHRFLMSLRSRIRMVVSSDKMFFFMSYDHTRYWTNCPEWTIPRVNWCVKYAIITQTAVWALGFGRYVALFNTR